MLFIGWAKEGEKSDEGEGQVAVDDAESGGERWGGIFWLAEA